MRSSPLSQPICTSIIRPTVLHMVVHLYTPTHLICH